MNNGTIKHGLRKNLPLGTIYNSQAAAIIVAVGFAFKLSSAPGIISADFGSSTFWIFLSFTALEMLCAIFIFAFTNMGGDGLLRATNNFLYKIVCLAASCWMCLKTVFYFCYCTSYLTHELFTGTQPFLIYVMFLLPVVYLGIKGTRSIARSCELFAPLFLAVIILNLAFLDSDMDFGRNLPVFSKAPGELLLAMPRYGLWLGDLFPFVFVRLRNKKMPYLTLGIASTWTIANLIVLIGVALYGNALKMVKDLLIHIASFNQLSLEIGRMEWTNLFAIIMMSLYSLFSFRRCKRGVQTRAGHVPALENNMSDGGAMLGDVFLVATRGDGRCTRNVRLRIECGCNHFPDCSFRDCKSSKDVASALVRVPRRRIRA